MSCILEFWFFIFWISLFILFFNQYNFMRLLLIAELIWGILYVMAALFGIETGNLCLISFNFIILVFAALEFVVGIILIISLHELNFGFNNLTNFSTINKKNSSYRWKHFFLIILNFN